MTSEPALDDERVAARADELVRIFSLDGSSDDLLALARACEGFDDPLSRAAGELIRTRALSFA